MKPLRYCPSALLFILLLPLAARAERSALDVYAEAEAGGYREMYSYSRMVSAAASARQLFAWPLRCRKKNWYI